MRRPKDDSDEFDEDDRDEPLASDQDVARGSGGSDDFEIVACPFCGKSMSDLAEVCPHCRSFVSREDLAAASKPLWVKVTIAILIASFVLGVVALR